MSRPLYLFSQFFEDKGIETLLGTGIKADYINDDKIGRVMDKLYKYGLNKIFMEIVLAAIKKFKIDLKYAPARFYIIPLTWGIQKTPKSKERNRNN